MKNDVTSFDPRVNEGSTQLKGLKTKKKEKQCHPDVPIFVKKKGS